MRKIKQKIGQKNGNYRKKRYKRSKGDRQMFVGVYSSGGETIKVNWDQTIN